MHTEIHSTQEPQDYGTTYPCLDQLSSPGSIPSLNLSTPSLKLPQHQSSIIIIIIIIIHAWYYLHIKLLVVSDSQHVPFQTIVNGSTKSVEIPNFMYCQFIYTSLLTVLFMLYSDYFDKKYCQFRAHSTLYPSRGVWSIRQLQIQMNKTKL